MSFRAQCSIKSKMEKKKQKKNIFNPLIQQHKIRISQLKWCISLGVLVFLLTVLKGRQQYYGRKMGKTDRK